MRPCVKGSAPFARVAESNQIPMARQYNFADQSVGFGPHFALIFLLCVARLGARRSDQGSVTDRSFRPFKDGLALGAALIVFLECGRSSYPFGGGHFGGFGFR